MAIHFTNTGETAPSFFLRATNKGTKEKKEQMNTRTLLVVSASVAAMVENIGITIVASTLVYDGDGYAP